MCAHSCPHLSSDLFSEVTIRVFLINEFISCFDFPLKSKATKDRRKCSWGHRVCGLCESTRRKHAVTQEVTDGKLHAKGRECKEYNKKKGGGG